MGILILLVFAIGVGTIIYYVGKGAVGLYRKAFGLQKGVDTMQTNSFAAQDGSGETGWFGLPKYRDVIVPEKHHYATVVYMDSPVKQYFYDLMAGWKRIGDSRERWVLLVVPVFFGGCLSLIHPFWGLLVGIFTLWFVFWMTPAAMRATRGSAEMSKNLTADDWRQVYRELDKSREREDEMTRAFRRSGIGHRW
jgi:hypothetical protein